jgi:putative hydrolase of the HAD superfamily
VSGNLVSSKTAVVFDFYGTLTPVGRPQAWTASTARMAQAMGVAPEALVPVLAETFSERMTGAYGDVRHTMEALATRLGVQLTAGQLDTITRIRREIQEASFVLRPEALRVLTRLRDRGLRLGLVSDCTTELPDAWPRLPLASLIAAPVFSCIEHMRKPDPRLFRTVASRLAVEPAQCVYVGDGGGGELTGASDVGMTAVLLAGDDWLHNRTSSTWRGDADWPGKRIASLTELLCEPDRSQPGS